MPVCVLDGEDAVLYGEVTMDGGGGCRAHPLGEFGVDYWKYSGCRWCELGEVCAQLSGVEVEMTDAERVLQRGLSDSDR